MNVESIMHCNYEQFFYTAVLGICAAFLTAKTRSVLPAMAIHFTMNFIGTMMSIAYSGLDTDNLDLEGMLQHPLKMLLLAGMNFLVIGILIAGCVLFIVELVKHRETFRLGNTVPQASGGKKALVYWTAPVTIVCVIVSLEMAIVNAIG